MESVPGAVATGSQPTRRSGRQYCNPVATAPGTDSIISSIRGAVGATSTKRIEAVHKVSAFIETVFGDQADPGAADAAHRGLRLRGDCGGRRNARSFDHRRCSIQRLASRSLGPTAYQVHAANQPASFTVRCDSDDACRVSLSLD